MNAKKIAVFSHLVNINCLGGGVVSLSAFVLTFCFNLMGSHLSERIALLYNCVHSFVILQPEEKVK